MRELLFSIDRLEFIGDGKALVGRRCSRDMMKTGDQVRSMVRLSAAAHGDKILEVEPVYFTLPPFQMYGKELEAIEPGCVAGIILSVQAATGLRLGWYLRGENQ
jgi:hypothetical protein